MHGVRRHLFRWFGTALLASVVTHPLFAQSLRTVALSGRPAPSGDGDPLTFDQIGVATLNDQGRVALVARAHATGQLIAGGIWSEGGGAGLELVAFDGRTAPGVAGGVFSGLDGYYPLINNAGQTLFRGRLATAPGITGTNNSGAWIADPSTAPTLVVREGEIAPGTSTGVFSEQSDVNGSRYSGFNDAGQFAWLTQLQIGTGGVTGNSDFGVWRAGAGPALMVGRESAVAAEISPTRFYGNIVGTPFINGVGQVAFFAPLKTSPTGTTSAGSGIWLGDPAVGIELIARDGDATPGVAGATFASFARPVINDAGEYAFHGTMAVAGEVTSENNAAIWAQRDGNPLALFVRESQHAPGTGPAVGFGAFDDTRINSAGQIAFRSVLGGIPGAGESGVTTLNDFGIWSDVGGSLELVVRENDPAPGTGDGVLFDAILAPTLNASGQMAFMTDLRGTGISAANNTAIWFKSPGEALQLIAREGDQLDVDDGPGIDLRTISALGIFSDSGGEDGQRSGLNDAGELVFIAAFTDTSSGVFVLSPSASPIPGDYNQNGTVDAADYTVWSDNFGSPTALPNDDTPGVGSDDYTRWKTNFGQSAGGDSSSRYLAGNSLAVPEPTNLLQLLPIAILSWCHLPSLIARRR